MQPQRLLILYVMYTYTMRMGSATHIVQIPSNGVAQFAHSLDTPGVFEVFVASMALERASWRVDNASCTDRAQSPYIITVMRMGMARNRRSDLTLGNASISSLWDWLLKLKEQSMTAADHSISNMSSKQGGIDLESDVLDIPNASIEVVNDPIFNVTSEQDQRDFNVSAFHEDPLEDVNVGATEGSIISVRFPANDCCTLKRSMVCVLDCTLSIDDVGVDLANTTLMNSHFLCGKSFTMQSATQQFSFELSVMTASIFTAFFLIACIYSERKRRALIYKQIPTRASDEVPINHDYDDFELGDICEDDDK